MADPVGNFEYRLINEHMCEIINIEKMMNDNITKLSASFRCYIISTAITPVR